MEIVAQKRQELLRLGWLEASSTGDLASDLTLRIGLDASNWIANPPASTK
jgi:hypothetical protein